MAERKRQIGIFKVIAKYDQPFAEGLLKKTDRRGHNVVTTAAFENDVKFIEGIHELNPELLLVRDNGGYTAITAAAFKGNFDIFVKLCELNPELLYMKDDHSYTAVTRAFYEGNTDMIELFKSFNLFRSSENPTNMNQQLYWDCLIASIKGGQFQSIKKLNLIYKINTFFLTIKTFLVLSAAYITCKKLLKYLNALRRNYVLTPVIQKRIDGLDQILAEHSKNSANCKEYVFEIYKLSGCVDSLTKSQQEKIEEFYTELIQEHGMDEFIDRCPITQKNWHELEDPVLCVSKFFEMKELARYKKFKRRPMHPVLNKKDVPIEYFQDDIIRRLIKSHRDMV